MKKFLGFAAIAALLAGCMEGETGADPTRLLAKQAVASVVQSKLPAGINATPITDCIVDNASNAELLTLASGLVSGGVNAAATSAVVEIGKRSSTQSCMLSAAQGGALFGSNTSTTTSTATTGLGGLSALSGLLGAQQSTTSSAATTGQADLASLMAAFL